IADIVTGLFTQKDNSLENNIPRIYPLYHVVDEYKNFLSSEE
ncbi:4703_t:CDS:1, partial [Ambispora gerdemannii]